MYPSIDVPSSGLAAPEGREPKTFLSTPAIVWKGGGGIDGAERKRKEVGGRN